MMTQQHESGHESGDEGQHRIEFGRPESSDWKRYARLTLWGVLAVIAVVFLVANFEPVDVSLVFASVEMPLIIALGFAMLLGASLGYGYAWLTARRKAREAAEQKKLKKKQKKAKGQGPAEAGT